MVVAVVRGVRRLLFEVCFPLFVKLGGERATFAYSGIDRVRLVIRGLRIVLWID